MLSGWLRIEVGKSRKQKRTAKQMHADLVVLGYDGSYERVAAFVRAWKAERQREQQTSGRGTFVPLVFAAGEPADIPEPGRCCCRRADRVRACPDYRALAPYARPNGV